MRRPRLSAVRRSGSPAARCSRECEAIRATADRRDGAIEAQIDFSDVEDADGLTLGAASNNGCAAQRWNRIDRALAGAGRGETVREGFVVVIAGPPNVGKSTLMNALAGRDVAITSPFAGTTRDLIEVFLDLRGLPVTLVDTAGIRDSRRSGRARRRRPGALRRAEHADLTLWLDDGDGASAAADGLALASGPRSTGPKAGAWLGDCADLAISAKTGEGIDKLLDAIADLAEERMASGGACGVDAGAASARPSQEASEALVFGAGAGSGEAELIAEDLRRAAAAMDRVVGRIGVEDVLGEIFSRLCVGK